MMRRIFLTFAIAFSLTSCMMGPNYYRPYVDVPETYQYETADAADTINTLWWHQFEDPVLTALIQEALANNYNIKIASANVEQALGVLIQTRSQLFPQIGYSATGMRERLSEITANPIPITVPNPQTTYQAIFQGSWEIDLWGRIRRLTESARANVLATAEAHRGVILTLVASVANTYLTLIGLDEQLTISQNTLNSYGKSVKYFETQFQYGQVSKMNVAQSLTQYETAAASIPQIEAQIIQTENALSILLGRNPGKIARGKSINDIKLPEVPEGIPSEILQQRPDVKQAEYDLIAANAQIGAARALYFPTISLTGQYGNASEELSKLFTGPARTWTYAGSITGPLFTFGNISGQVMQAVAARNAALYGYKQAIINAFADVETALSSSIMLAKQLEAEGRLVAAASEYEHLAKLQYDGGYSPYITVLQAQIQLFPAELTQVQTRVLLYTSVVNIYSAMGGGWVIEAECMTR
jgi:multidrug efflux system outer membrane protein